MLDLAGATAAAAASNFICALTVVTATLPTLAGVSGSSPLQYRRVIVLARQVNSHSASVGSR